MCMYICIHVLWSSYNRFKNQFFPSIIWVLVIKLGFQVLVSALPAGPSHNPPTVFKLRSLACSFHLKSYCISEVILLVVAL